MKKNLALSAGIAMALTFALISCNSDRNQQDNSSNDSLPAKMDNVEPKMDTTVDLKRDSVVNNNTH